MAPKKKSNAPQERVDAGLVEEDFEQQPQSDAVADGEAVGDVDDSGVVASAPSTFSNAYVSQEEQGMEMKPAVVGPPSYGSPDPTTSAGKLVPLEQHPLRADALPEGHPAAISEKYGRGYDGTLTGAETVASRSGAGGRTDLEKHRSEGNKSAGNDEVDATDGARELASEHNVDLSQVNGTGADGRVTKSDVEDYLDSQEND